MATHGFTIAFQLFFFKRVPELESFLPDPEDHNTFTNDCVQSLAALKLFHNCKIMDVENMKDLVFKPYREDPERIMDEDVNVWDDEVMEESLDYLEVLIGQDFKFSKSMWLGDYAKWLMIGLEKKLKVKEKKVKGKGKGTRVEEHSRGEEEGVGQGSVPFDVEAVYEQMEALNAACNAVMMKFIESMKKTMMDDKWTKLPASFVN